MIWRVILNPIIIDSQVVGVSQLTSRVKEYLLAPVNGQALPRYEPGSHIELHLSSCELGDFVRHYSLVGGRSLELDGSGLYRIAVQREDRSAGSDFIHRSLQEGSQLRISVPRNNFLLGRNDTRSLLIAGGIGITPIYSMLRSLVRRNKNFDFVYSGRIAEQMAYLSEAMELAGGRGRVHISGADGKSVLDLYTLLQQQSDETTVYVCGPAGMVNATHKAASDLGWADGRVRSELFSVANSLEDAPFEVKLARSGHSIMVGQNTSILDALSSAGINLLYDCRRGECGLCPLPVLEADGPIDHRDRYLSEEERSAGNTMCLCVSRIKGKSLTLDI